MNENEILTYLTDQLRLRSAGMNNLLQSPQGKQAFETMMRREAGTLGDMASKIIGNRVLGTASFVPDMIRLQYGGLTPQERIYNANQYLQRQGSAARINPDGSWSL